MSWDDFTDGLTQFGEKLGRWLKGLFGSENERIVRAMEPVIAAVNELEPWAQDLDQEGIRAEMGSLKKAKQFFKKALLLDLEWWEEIDLRNRCSSCFDPT